MLHVTDRTEQLERGMWGYRCVVAIVALMDCTELPGTVQTIRIIQWHISTVQTPFLTLVTVLQPH
jgi:hypothetical protein